MIAWHWDYRDFFFRATLTASVANDVFWQSEHGRRNFAVVMEWERKPSDEFQTDAEAPAMTKEEFRVEFEKRVILRFVAVAQ